MKNICFKICSSILFLFPFCVIAQKENFSDEIKFVQYLNDREMYKEAIYVLQNIDKRNISDTQEDTLYYQLGWMLYNMKQLEESVNNLVKVSKQSNYYFKARNFAAYILTYLHRTDTAKIIYQSIEAQDSLMQEMENFELSGIALLGRNFDEFNRLRQSFTYSSYVFGNEEKKIEKYYTEISQYKYKSPFLAGLYSAIIPGAGKFYVGKKAQGLGSFLPIFSMALLTFEAYRKGGISNARFITFGSVFTIFYVGNIWSSVLAVKVANNDFNKEYESKILFDMHIPLRKFFN